MGMPLSLSTERLALRLLGPDDLDAVHALFSRPGRALGEGPVADPAVTRAWLERRVVRHREHGLGWYGLRLRDGTFVGTCGVFTGDRCRDDPEIGYELGDVHQGRGFAREAARRVTAAAHAAGHRRLWATIRPSNGASIRLARSVGYRWVRQEVDARGALDFYVSLAGPGRSLAEPHG
ncbi:Protein N-acetyltransferase, RimJ/RimL family [Blastococcus aurantiacus]|uniref:Protein N-acetyltransferase, RimJ/RimL family n=1 Tax=Blastococcus aurantiacus TaxID=1550231 RepID=A0A1G7H9V4_9ACTN|nr:GNAT family N-acetyltransferase [Blastococcus aurantiacus]SDE97237.1 Protein N-acetyltransferase, RimJ/RimL family [Blastococcus aurantiacus]